MKKYIQGTLAPDEKVLLTPELHWINYIIPVLWTLIWLPLILGFVYLYSSYISDSAFVNAVVSSFACLCFLGYIGYKFLENKFTEMAGTSKRVVRKRGIIMVDAAELQNKKIESIEIKQSVPGRILGYGNVCFSGVGTSKVIYKAVSNPWKIKTDSASIIESNRNE